MTMTTQKWKAVIHLLAQALHARANGYKDEWKRYSELAWVILMSCDCCPRHRGARPVAFDDPTRTPASEPFDDPTRTPASEPSDDPYLSYTPPVCECGCRSLARTISETMTEPEDGTILGFDPQREYWMVNSVSNFARMTPHEMTRLGIHLYDLYDPEEEEYVEEDEEEYIIPPFNVPSLDQRFQAVGENVVISPEVVRQINEIDTSVVPTKTAHQTLENVMGTPAFCADNGERIVTRATNCEPLCYWWTDCNKRCLACLKTGMARGDIPVSQEVVLFLLEE